MTECYQVDIQKFSAGIFVNSKGFGISLVGIEERLNEKREHCRRYWVLNYWGDKKVSVHSIHNYLIWAGKYSHIKSINTNFKSLLEILNLGAIVLLRTLLNYFLEREIRQGEQSRPELRRSDESKTF